MSTRTGPGRPVAAMWKASAMVRAMSSALGDQEVVLRDRHRDAADVGFLEGVGADRLGGDLAGDRDERHGVHVRVRDRGDQVGGAGARGGHADADLAGGLRVPGGGVAGPLLVTDQDVPDAGGVHQRVVGREDAAAGDAEHRVGTDFLKSADEGLRAREVFDGDGRLSAGTGARLRVVGPGGLLGHRHSLLEAEGFRGWFFAGGLQRFERFSATKNPSCREASEGSAPGAVRGVSWSDSASADALSKYENSGAHGIDPLSGTHDVSSGWDRRLSM